MESLGHHKVIEHAVYAVELIALVSGIDFCLHLGQAGEHELVERHKVGDGDRVALGLEIVLKNGEQETQGVAETTVRVGGTGEDLVIAGDVRGRIHAGDPQAHDVGAHLVADLVGSMTLPETWTSCGPGRPG